MRCRSSGEWGLFCGRTMQKSGGYVPRVAAIDCLSALKNSAAVVWKVFCRGAARKACRRSACRRRRASAGDGLLFLRDDMRTPGDGSIKNKSDEKTIGYRQSAGTACRFVRPSDGSQYRRARFLETGCRRFGSGYRYGSSRSGNAADLRRSSACCRRARHSL